MSRLNDFRLLSFDVYGTLIDWDTGVMNSLEESLGTENLKNISRQDVLQAYTDLERAQQAKTPGLLYSELLTTLLPQVASKLGFPQPSEEQSRNFGASIGRWPAFPDTVDALHRLAKKYKLVVLSNVDRDSFAATNAGPLQGFPFDLIITAQDIGSYKPNLNNFKYMLEAVKTKFGVEKSEVLQTAHSQFHDHQPAQKMDIRSVWIERPGTTGDTDTAIFDWKFSTLGDMADALESE